MDSEPNQEVPTETSAELAPKADQAPLSTDPVGFTWTASEFIAHEKSAGWYVWFTLGSIVLIAAIFLLTHSLISCAALVVGLLLAAVYAGREPRELEYGLNASGFQVGPKHYRYEDFRYFSIAQEGAFAGIDFMPLKRIAAVITLYFDPADETKIMTILQDRLPHQDHHLDPVDRLVRRLRF